MPDNAYLKFERTITMGNIGQMLLFGGAVLMWLVGGSNKADQAQHDLATLSAQIAEVKTTMDRRFDGIQAPIQLIPTFSERIAQQDRRITAVEDRKFVEDGRLNALEQGVAAMKSDVANLAKERDQQGHR